MGSKAAGMCGFWLFLAMSTGEGCRDPLQILVLRDRVEDEGGFLPFSVSALSSALKADRFLGEALILATVPLKSFSFSSSICFETVFHSLACFPKLLPFLVPLSLRGKKYNSPSHKQQQRPE